MSNQSDTILLDLNYLPSGHGVADLGRKYIFLRPFAPKGRLIFYDEVD